MLELAVSSPPDVDESLVGYLYRLASLNAVSGQEIVRAFRSKNTEATTFWLREIGAPWYWFDMMRELKEPETRSARLWNFRTHKFCPLCILERQHWRASWHLMLVTICAEHNVSLLDHCPSCGSRLRAAAMRDFCCTSCGQALAHIHESSIPPEFGARWVAKQFECRLAGIRANDVHPVNSLDLHAFHELTLRLGIRGIRPKKDKPLKLRDAGALAISMPIAAISGSALSEWPKGFHQLLDTIRSYRAEKSSWKIKQAIGPIYRDIYQELVSPNFDFVQQEFESYLQNSWEGPLARRNRNLDPQLVMHHRWVPLDEAAKIARVELALIRRLVASNELPSREFRHENGRTFRLVDVASTTAITERLQNALTLEQAAKDLVLAERRVRQLLNAGLLIPIGGAPAPGEHWWIDLISIQQLATCRVHAGHSRGVVSISHLAKYQLCDAEEFVALLEAIRSGQLYITGHSEIIQEVGNWLLDRSIVTLWLTTRKAEADAKMTIAKAAEFLGVKQEVAYALVRLDILQSKAEIIGRRPARLITKSALHQFQNHYVFGTELASQLRISAKYLPSTLSNAGFLPVAGPEIRNMPCRQYLWRRTIELMKFTNENRRK